MIQSPKSPSVISVASGKGGVGKTITAVNMAMNAQAMGYKTLILDGDLGLSNVNIVLGLSARYNISDALNERVSMKEVVLEGPRGIHIIPGGSGISGLAELSLAQRINLLEKIDEVARNYDLLIVDTGAGISTNVIHLNSIADAVVVVTTPEPHALTDAYAFIKIMCETHGAKNFYMVINKVLNEGQGLKIFQNFADVAKRNSYSEVMLGGTVPRDDLLERSVMAQRAAGDHIAHTRSGQAWNEITRRILEQLQKRSQQAGRRGFQNLMFPKAALQSVSIL